MSKTFGKKNNYPLQWPGKVPRTKTPESSRFRTSLFDALNNVEESLELLAKDSGKKIDNISFTSNVTLGQMHPDDPGVCVYFDWGGNQMCVPVDRYETPEENLQAIYHLIEADRTKLRHGGYEFVMAEKRGDMAMLPDPNQRDWREVLGINGETSLEEVRKKYKQLAKQHHSDRGGDDQTMAIINQAWDAAKKELT